METAAPGRAGWPGTAEGGGEGLVLLSRAAADAGRCPRERTVALFSRLIPCSHRGRLVGLAKMFQTSNLTPHVSTGVAVTEQSRSRSVRAAGAPGAGAEERSESGRRVGSGSPESVLRAWVNDKQQRPAVNTGRAKTPAPAVPCCGCWGIPPLLLCAGQAGDRVSRNTL